jgi:hypothetical protein
LLAFTHLLFFLEQCLGASVRLFGIHWKSPIKLWRIAASRFARLMLRPTRPVGRTIHLCTM